MGTIKLLPGCNSFKANLHCHTTVSDGCFTPVQIKELYKNAGYSIVAYTDHCVFKYHKDLDDPGFLALAGYELNTRGQPAAGVFHKTCHLNAIARNPDKVAETPQLDQYDPARINEIIARLKALDFMVNYNHPAWSAEEPSDYCPLEGITGFEIYNHGTQVSSFEGLTSGDYAMWLKYGRQSWAIAADDNHNRFENKGITDSCGGWVVISASELRYGLIIEALEKGWFYSSTGPEIRRLDLDDGILTLECSPVRAAVLKTPAIGENPQNLYSSQDTITQATFDLRKIKRFARVELMDGNGKTAFSNPVFLI
jgi:hypothetical protein